MKKCEKNPKRWLGSFVAVCLLSVFLSSCLKESNNNYYNPPAALVNFIQASPDQPPIDFFLDNNKVNTFPINYGDNIDYFRAYTGKRTATFNNASTGVKIFSDTLHFNQNTDYSLFLANKAGSPEIVLLTDSISRPAAGYAAIRFVNLSPDAPPVSLAIQGSQVLATNEPYKGHTSFVPIQAGANYTFQVSQGTTATVLATLSNVALNGGYVYTIWFHGLATGTTAADQLSVSIITNAYYY